MKFKWIRSNKNSLKFIFFLAVMGLIVGVLLYFKSGTEVKTGIINKLSNLTTTIYSTNQNNIIFHLSVLSILLMLSLIVIGVPLILFYYFYEFVSIGYLLSALFDYKKFSGLLFGSIFVIINKILFLLFLTYFLLNSIRYGKRILKNFKASKSDIIINQLYKGLFVIGLTLLNDIILYFVGNKLLSIFIFLN